MAPPAAALHVSGLGPAAYSLMITKSQGCNKTSLEAAMGLADRRSVPGEPLYINFCGWLEKLK